MRRSWLGVVSAASPGVSGRGGRLRPCGAPGPLAMSVEPVPEFLLSLDPVAAGHADAAAEFVVGLLADPGADIRVHEGQLGLAEEIVVPGHPDAFELRPIEAADPGTVWAVDGGSS